MDKHKTPPSATSGSVTPSPKVAYVSRVEGDALNRSQSDADGGVRIQAPYNKTYFTAIKQAVPWSFRRWMPDLLLMVIAHPYDQVAIDITAQYFEVRSAILDDGMPIAERFWSEPASPGHEFEPGLKVKERHVP